jgi:hypothetical protein
VPITVPLPERVVSSITKALRDSGREADRLQSEAAREKVAGM